MFDKIAGKVNDAAREVLCGLLIQYFIMYLTKYIFQSKKQSYKTAFSKHDD